VPGVVGYELRDAVALVERQIEEPSGIAVLPGQLIGLDKTGVPNEPAFGRECPVIEPRDDSGRAECTRVLA
jgi:hypothetical protein